MSIPGSASPLFIGAAAGAAAAYQIDRSLRFNSADSAYLNRTPSAAGNRKTWTWSGWVKRSGLGVNQSIFGTRTGSSDADILDLFFANGNYGTTKDALTIGRYSFYDFITNALFRDVSAWYHIVLAYDTTQATASNRIKLYVNGNEQTFSSVTYPALNADLPINKAAEHEIGGTDPTNYLNGYLTEVHFVDGQALAATDFGESDSDNNWNPKAYTGSYGTNGFYLKFADNSSNAALGTDSSGNNNTFTVHNISAADGAAVTVGAATGAQPIRNTTGDQGGTAASGFRTDANASNLYLALPLNSNTSDVSNSINSNSTTKTTTNQSTATSSSKSRFYGASSYWNANTDGILVAESGSELVFGTGDFTIEFWFYDDGNHDGTGSRCYLFSTDLGGSITAQILGYVDSSANIRYYANGGTITSAQGANGTDNKWFHYAVVRSSGTTTLYVNGVSAGSHSDTTNYGSNGIAVGRTSDSNYGWAGYIQDFRVYKAAKYTSDFKIPAEANPTVGAACDSLLDTPTNYDDGTNVGGNHATLNPLAKDSGTTLSNGNLELSSTNYGNNTATFFLTSGKWYYEVQGTGYAAAICGKDGINWNNTISATGSNSIGYYVNGTVYYDGGSSSGGASFSSSDILGVALDMDAGVVYFYKNNNLEYTITFGSGAVPDLSDGVFPCYNNGSTSDTKTAVYNFGQRPFAYTPPTGYVSLCTTNLPDPTIADGSTAFDTALYTGNGSTQTISGLNFSPSWVWLKIRNTAGDHGWWDILRGTSSRLNSASTAAEDTTVGVTAFNSDGFTVGGPYNSSSNTWAAWAWDAGTSTVSNTDGSITSQVRANQTAGFSIVSFTGNGSTNQTVGHGLNAKPSIVIYKNRDATTAWRVIPAFINDGHYLALNNTDALFTTSGSYFGTNTSSVLGISGSYSGIINANGNDIIAYCFAPVEGFSAMGSYVGNGSADGPFVYTGFKTKLLIRKRINSTGGWYLIDTERDSHNVANAFLDAKDSDAEASGTSVDILSNGFKLRNTDIGTNGSSDTYLYIAFAEHPFKTARAR